MDAQAMSDLSEQMRDNAREWDISECPQRAEIARRAADRIEELEAENERLRLCLRDAEDQIEGRTP
jgi:hypothetical protein